MARKYFHLHFEIVLKNKTAEEEGRERLPPLRLLIPDQRELNRFFWEVVCEGPTTLTSDVGYAIPKEGQPMPPPPRVGMWTEGAVIVDGVRIE